MKVAVASTGLGHVARGIESWAADLGRALADRGEDVLLCRGAGPPSAQFERAIACWPRESAAARRAVGAMPRGVGWRIGLGSAYQVEQGTFAAGLVGVLRRERVDILHVQDPHLALLIHRARRLGLVSTRTILAHGTEEPPGFLARFDYVQQLAPWHLEQSRLAGVARPGWSAIPNFIDADRFRPGRSEAIRAELGLGPDDLVVLTTAAIKRSHKRIDYLIDEFAGLVRARPDLPARLVVAGGWESETDELIRHGRDVLGDRVRFLVRFPRDRMADLCRAADVFALTSLFEMMPIALLEALACGLPCLVHRHPVLEWIVGDGGSAIDMSAGGSLAAALGARLADPGWRASAGAAARRHCVEQYGRDRVVARIVEYYRRVIGESGLTVGGGTR